MPVKYIRKNVMSPSAAWVYSVSIVAVTVLIVYFNSYYGGHH